MIKGFRPPRQSETQPFPGITNRYYICISRWIRRALKKIQERLGGTSLDPEKNKTQIRSLEIKLGLEEAKVSKWLDLLGEGKMSKEILCNKGELRDCPLKKLHNF
jgi:hypothetical protein